MKNKPFAGIKQTLLQTGVLKIPFQDLESYIPLPTWMNHALEDGGFVSIERIDEGDASLPAMLVEPEFNFHALTIGSLQHLSQLVAYYPIIGERNSIRYQGLWATISLQRDPSYWVLLAYPAETRMKITEARILIQEIATKLLEVHQPSSHRAA